MKGQPHKCLHMVQGQIHRKYIDVSGELGTSLMCVGFDLVFISRQPLLGNPRKPKGLHIGFRVIKEENWEAVSYFSGLAGWWGRTPEDSNVLGQLEKKERGMIFVVFQKK